MKIIIAIVVIIILVVAIYATYYTLFIKVKFDTPKAVYHENILGALTGISVTGYLKNNGIDDVLVDDVSFRCEAKFLVDKLDESLEVSIVDSGTMTIPSGGKVEFDLYVGDPADTTLTTKGDLVVLYKGIENDRFTLDVTGYYK
jgi:hypothetical protein